MIDELEELEFAIEDIEDLDGVKECMTQIVQYLQRYTKRNEDNLDILYSNWDTLVHINNTLTESLGSLHTKKLIEF